MSNMYALLQDGENRNDEKPSEAYVSPSDLWLYICVSRI